MNRIVTIVGVIAIIIVGFLIWNQLTSGDAPIFSNTESNAQGSATVSALLQMRSLKLDGRLFDNPAFVSLVDTNKEIIPEPVGRANPFAPIGVDDVVMVPEQSQGDEQFDDASLDEGQSFGE